MTGPRSQRRALLLCAGGGALLAASGCVSIGGGDATALVWYRLEDRGDAVAAPPNGASPAAGGAGSGAAGAGSGAAGAGASAPAPVLLVGPVAAAGFYDSAMLAFSRAPGTLAHYQFAGWSERPGRRIATLAERRLSGRGRFAAVAQSTAGVRGDLLLNLSLEHLYHDVSAVPGTARAALGAELLDWRARRLIARRDFDRSTPVAREAAADAVAAINRALGEVLDELCPWVEAAALGYTGDRNRT
ncbi:MAG TPA: ABC-type transport auxiliary lipoprotein family protein [Burkholderiaceae bacterium]